MGDYDLYRKGESLRIGDREMLVIGADHALVAVKG